jgi:hypothetical protein
VYTKVGWRNVEYVVGEVPTTDERLLRFVGGTPIVPMHTPGCLRNYNTREFLCYSLVFDFVFALFVFSNNTSALEPLEVIGILLSSFDIVKSCGYCRILLPSRGLNEAPPVCRSVGRVKGQYNSFLLRTDVAGTGTLRILGNAPAGQH